MQKEQDSPHSESKSRKSFILYTDYANIIDSFDDADAGVLLKAILHYETGTGLPKMSEKVGVAFDFIRNQLDRDFESYMVALERKKAAGRKGGLIRAGAKAQADQEYAAFIKQTQAPPGSTKQNLATLSSTKQNLAVLSTTKQNLAFQDDNDSDNDSDNDNDNDNDSDSVSVCVPEPGSSIIRPAVKSSGYYHTPYSDKKALNMARRGTERNTDYNSLVARELLEAMHAES